LTVTVAQAPKLATSAADQSDGDKTLDARSGTVVDTVAYEGLTPGVEYTLKGELVSSPDGERIGITGEVTFTPAQADGTVEVTFEVPAGYDGRTLVVFERAYDADGVVATHEEDPDDPAQTVTVAQAPKLATSQKKSKNLPKMGDASMTLGSEVLALSGIALLGLYHRIKE
jgi:hypothetical protein